ncbi:ATP synthase mitochondrial F1 complex assembly factor 2 isoform X1 [Osmia bicornis bicornis]|uniref:ATP synthase mitochondrial F1 complex assembly factor 2 isoform X1 n=1 Tax=Osmia bicornis bicornis TaxID=1437191 RepID=UPI0010F66208|nr:ATP synthase mitochondrial F1 complex assembly factor 2 isoform X1 [Osmia bicornis bicornis]
MTYFKYKRFVTALNIVRNMATVKRFYRRTNILSSGGTFEITLDQRKLKTPQGKVLQVDSKPLALAIAAEWDMQTETIDKSNMHLTALSNTVIDNPNNHTKENVVNYIVNCLEMDTVLFHSNESDDLYKLQIKHWDPLVQWFCDNYGVNMTKTQSIQAPAVSEETKKILTRHLMSYNYNAVYGFMYGVDAIKSVILTLAAAERMISIKDAVKLSRLEEDYQTSHWGSIEWFHDHSKYDLQARLAAAILFVHLNSYSVTHQPKDVNKNVM